MSDFTVFNTFSQVLDKPGGVKGLKATIYCPRKRTDCRSLAQTISENGGFICSGHNTFDEGRKVDPFTFCFNNGEIDTTEYYDHRDMVDRVSVMMQALSLDFNMRLGSQETKIELDPSRAAGFNNGNRIKRKG